MGSILPPVLGWLQQRKMVAVGIREVGIYAERLVLRRRLLELHAAGPEEIDVFAAVVRPEHPVVPAAVRVRRRARIDDVPSLQEDELELQAFGRDGEPAGAAGLLVVLALLEAKPLHIELQRPVLIADDDRDVGRLLDDAIIVRAALPSMLGWSIVNKLPSGSLKDAEMPHACFCGSLYAPTWKSTPRALSLS